MHGIELFQRFQKFEIVPHVHGRSQDRQHSENLRRMREDCKPITKNLLSCYKRLSKEDVQNDSEFEFAPLITPTNVERASVNKDAVIRFARKKGLPVLFWVNEYGKVPSAVRRRCPNELTVMSEKYFVPGSPCMVTKNLLPTEITGVVNGSKGVLHSLSWSHGYQVPSGWKPGEIVKVPVPSHVNVLLDDEILPCKKIKKGELIPCSIHTGHINVGGAKLNMRQHPVTLLFAVTPFKVQGQTTPRLILDLRYKEGRSLRNLGFEDIYVAISRLQKADHLRIIMSDDGRTDHITRLRRPIHFSRWMNCYTPDGLFDGSNLRRIAEEEREKALEIVQNWTIKEMRKQKRSRLLFLARRLGERVERSGKGNQPLKEDVWNALFPIWRAADPSRSSYKSRQETFHDQNLIKNRNTNTVRLSTKTKCSKSMDSGPMMKHPQTPVHSRHPPINKNRKPGSRSSPATPRKNGSPDYSQSQSHKKRKSSNRTLCRGKRLRFHTNTSPPRLKNYGHTCYINAGLQALSGSPTIANCSQDVENSSVTTYLIKALGSVSSNSEDEDQVNTIILECIMKDVDLRKEFTIEGHQVKSLKVTHQPADLLARKCLDRMTHLGCVQPKDLCQYKSSMTCTNVPIARKHMDKNLRLLSLFLQEGM